MPDAMTATDATPAAGLLANTVALNLSLRKPGVWRRVGKGAVDGAIRAAGADAAPVPGAHVDVEEDVCRVQKRLWDSPEFRAVGTLDALTKAWLRQHATPSFLRGGIYLIPLPLVEQCSAYLDEQRGKRAAAVEIFLAVYPQTVPEAARASLRALYDEGDYPTVPMLRQAFGMEWEYVSFQTPTNLKTISAQFFAQEKAKAEARWSEVSASVEQLLFGQLQELLAKVTERLTPGADGKPKTFRDSLLTGLGDFLTLADVRNVTGNAQLSELTGKLRAALSGVDPKSLRKVDGMKEALVAQFKVATDQLDELVIAKPTRKMLVTVEEE